MYFVIACLVIWFLAGCILPRKNGRTYFWRSFLTLDQAANVLLLNGNEDETVSSRFAKNRDKWWGKAGCYCLDAIDPDHCDKSVECDEGESCEQ